MKGTRGITIATDAKGQVACERLMRSLWLVSYPVLIVVNDHKEVPPEWWHQLYTLSGEMNWHLYPQNAENYMLGALDKTLEVTRWEEIILIQDTIQVKNIQLFNTLFEDHKDRSVSYGGLFELYFAKYQRELLNKVKPFAAEFSEQYGEIAGVHDIFNPLFIAEDDYLLKGVAPTLFLTP